MAPPSHTLGVQQASLNSGEPTESSPLLGGHQATTDLTSDEEAAEGVTKPSLNDEFSSSSVTGILSVLLIGVFISQADGTLVLATYGKIASEFKALQDASWLLSSYMLAMCVAQPLYGKLSDIFGIKTMLQISYGLFSVGSILCGFCQSLSQITLARVVQGLGGAGMICLVSILVTDLVPLRDVATYRSYVNVVQTVGRSSGGAIGGVLAQVVGWRWALAGQGPLTICAMFLVAWRLDLNSLTTASGETSGERVSSLRDKLGRVDFAGCALLTATILPLLVVLDIGGEKLPWSSPLIVGLAATGVASGFLFVFAERRSKEPVFPLHLLTNLAVVNSYLLLLLQMTSQMALMFTIPMYFQVTKGVTTGEAGAFMVPSVVGNTCGGLLTGYYIKRYGGYKLPTMIAGLSSVLCFSLLLVFWRGHTSVWQSLFVFPGGFATGVAQSAVFVALAASVDTRDMAVASSGFYLAGSIGSVAGIASASAIFTARLRAELPRALSRIDVPNRQEIIRHCLSDITFVQSLAGDIREAVIDAYLSGFRATFFFCISIAGACLTLGIFSKHKQLA